MSQVASTVKELNAERPSDMAPIEVHHRSFVQHAHSPAPVGDPWTALSVEAAEAANAGFTEYIIEHNFWDGISSPDDWAAVPERFPLCSTP